MIGTSHRGPIQRSVFGCVWRSTHWLKKKGAVCERQTAPALFPSGRFYILYMGRTGSG
ncbi:unnamed protein product [Staurois parvus]|uniref:Uncharacterized protein n=1 Tax=Staurois parvus TaxID=386267 RepID=A0ABN9F510_9NEOB|nr:unnamed protein product [Staurois parvus]